MKAELCAVNSSFSNKRVVYTLPDWRKIDSTKYPAIYVSRRVLIFVLTPFPTLLSVLPPTDNYGTLWHYYHFACHLIAPHVSIITCTLHLMVVYLGYLAPRKPLKFVSSYQASSSLMTNFCRMYSIKRNSLFMIYSLNPNKLNTRIKNKLNLEHFYHIGFSFLFFKVKKKLNLEIVIYYWFIQK